MKREFDGPTVSIIIVCVALGAVFATWLNKPKKSKMPPQPQAAISLDKSEVQTCFTPGEDCTKFVVNAIQLAQKELRVQAYNYTSMEVLKAVADAKTERKLDVRIILDRSNEQARYCNAYLVNRGLEPLTDSHVAIAHNKVMVIDGKHVLTGSFNFTESAQKRNAENVILITNNTALAQRYLENWNKRAAVSRPFENHCSEAANK